MIDVTDTVEIARTVLLREAASLISAEKKLGNNIVHAVELLRDRDSKIIVSGIGKSGHVARKIAATMCSTGTPAIFMHATEAVHGDLGIYSPGDPTILISKSGTGEVMRLVPILRDFQSPLIAIVGNTESPLANGVDIFLDASVDTEADPYNLAPTSSSTLAMALGDSLAIALMQIKRFSPDDFVRFHPGGQLGRNLTLKVEDVMQNRSQIALVRKEQSMKEVMIAMTTKPMGAACVVDESYRLEGVITDGDLRRALINYDDIRSLIAQEIMTTHPITASKNTLLNEALSLMENRPSPISILPVVDAGICLGLLRIHDIYS